MSQAARNLIGSVGELMLRHLHDVEQLVSGYEDYAVMVDTNWRWPNNAAFHVDTAVVAIDEWRRQVLRAMEVPAPNRQY